MTMKKKPRPGPRYIFALAILVGLAAGPRPAYATDIALDTAVGTFILPFQVVNGTQLYSFKEGKGYPGAETVLWRKGKFQATFGAAPVLGTDTNVPFVGVQTRLSPVVFDTSNNELQFGAFAGKPSRRNDPDKPRWVFGIKASIPLW